jgi:glycosyltransferase involved in cell wall biosynthesis
MATDGVAVIVPLYNGAKWIEETLASVMAQELRASEVVVVDDGSTDDGEAVVRRFPGVRYVRNPAKGPNHARRHGCELTSAPLVAFLDQDDIWHPQHLGSLSRLLKEHPNFWASHGTEVDFRVPDKPLVWREAVRRPVYFDAWVSFPAGPRIGTPSSVVMRRSSLDGVGGWPTEVSGMTDYFAWLALSANGTPKGGFLSSLVPTVGRRRHQESHSALLRRDRAVFESYADSLLAASMAAAERFGSKCSLDRPTLRRRIEIAKVFHGLCCRAAAGEWDIFRREAVEMEKLTSVEPENLRKKVAGMLIWMLNAPRSYQEAIELFGRMAECWPASDSISRDAFTRKRDAYRDGEKKAGRVL